jgi:AcrR family transcriptional regulator
MEESGRCVVFMQDKRVALFQYLHCGEVVGVACPAIEPPPPELLDPQPASTGRVGLSDTQVQILDAALDIITEDGVRGASMRKVAERAEVSLGLLSYHFEDKQELITSAFTLSCSRLIESSEAALASAGHDPGARLRTFVRGPFYADFLAADFLALRITVWAVARTDSEISAVEEAHYSQYIDRLAGLVCGARPDLSPAQAREAAIDVSAMQNGLWLDFARHEDEEALERGLQRCEAVAEGRV